MGVILEVAVNEKNGLKKGLVRILSLVIYRNPTETSLSKKRTCRILQLGGLRLGCGRWALVWGPARFRGFTIWSELWLCLIFRQEQPLVSPDSHLLSSANSMEWLLLLPSIFLSNFREYSNWLLLGLMFTDKSLWRRQMGNSGWLV